MSVFILGAGHVSAEQAKGYALKQYKIFDEHRLQVKEEQDLNELVQCAKSIKDEKRSE